MYSYPTDASKVTTMQSVSEGAFISLSNTFRNTMAITLKKEKKKKKRERKKHQLLLRNFLSCHNLTKARLHFLQIKTMVVS